MKLKPVLLLLLVFAIGLVQPAPAATFASVYRLLFTQSQGVLTAANVAGIPSPWNASSLTQFSWGSIGTASGANSVHLDLNGTYTGTVALYQVTNVQVIAGTTVGDARPIPLTNFRNDATGDYLGPASGAKGSWTGIVSGAGALFLVTGSSNTGSVYYSLDAGPAGGPANPGAGSATVNPVASPLTFTSTTPTVANTTSVTLVAAGTYHYVEIQNNTAANIAISLSGAVLTGIVAGVGNSCIVLTPGQEWASPNVAVPSGGITGYQTSGSSTNAITVVTA